ncbi:MAG: pyridoxamine 5'-phosphate oxidase [Bacteroidales bacterium]|jgi:pyridoxamine 5'-phosphate oxidase|nr:pyridoxamine 5'-phosphate oxidase [Bacteroidales bacterium]HOI33378.1 pyridoxamine 5'-phosphate oxidase [Bacteroidales bacterium]
MAKSYHHIRQNYGKVALVESEMPDNPILFFSQWFDEALKDQLPDANAMVLSTVYQNKPSSRVVLLKAIEQNSLVFFTNYNSRKGREIASNPQVSVLFFWTQHERQIRIEGRVEKISEEYAEDYFISRPLESQAAAIASNQSEKINNKAELIQRYEHILMEADSIKRPVHWGGYQLIPHYFEFWQGGANRLHDRMIYELTDQNWQISRLSP